MAKTVLARGRNDRPRQLCLNSNYWRRNATKFIQNQCRCHGA